MKAQQLPASHTLIAATLFSVLTMTPLGSAQSQPMSGMTTPRAPILAEDRAAAPPGMTLAELEQMALSRNPTLIEAASGIRAATARKLQSGLYPNPTVGYLGEQIRGGIQGGGEQGFFVSQDIVLGRKLALNREIFEQEKRQTEAEAEKQRLRVINSVRISYYQSLAAQAMVDLRHQLSQLAKDAVETSRQLGNVGQADQPDVLQAEVEQEQAELAIVAAEQSQKRLWLELAVTVDQPALPLTR